MRTTALWFGAMLVAIAPAEAQNFIDEFSAQLDDPRVKEFFADAREMNACLEREGDDVQGIQMCTGLSAEEAAELLEFERELSAQIERDERQAREELEQIDRLRRQLGL